MNYYIYKYENANEIVYIGQTIRLLKRHSEHLNQDEWCNNNLKVFYFEVTNKETMDLYEKILISKYKPKYNSIFIEQNYNFDFNEPTWKPLDDFNEKNEKKLSKTDKKRIIQIEKYIHTLPILQIEENEYIKKDILIEFIKKIKLEVDEDIKKEQKEGIDRAKAAGKYSGRQPMKIDTAKFERMYKEWRNGERTAASIYREFGISNTTFYRWIHDKERFSFLKDEVQ